jgi:hypothetical protein
VFTYVTSKNVNRRRLRTELMDVTTLAALEAACNEALVAHLAPRIRRGRHKVATDLTFIPYHGKAAQDPNEIRRGKAKSGTTRLHCYATAYVKKEEKARDSGPDLHPGG